MTGDVAPLVEHISWWPLVIALVAGLLVGFVHFASLLRNSELFAERGRLRAAILIQLAHLSLVVLTLSAAAWAGAGPLLAAALGLLVARAGVMRRCRSRAAG